MRYFWSCISTWADLNKQKNSYLPYLGIFQHSQPPNKEMGCCPQVGLQIHTPQKRLKKPDRPRAPSQIFTVHINTDKQRTADWGNMTEIGDYSDQSGQTLLIIKIKNWNWPIFSVISKFQFIKLYVVFGGVLWQHIYIISTLKPLK